MVNTFLQLFKGFNFSVEEFNLIISKMEVKKFKKNEVLLKIGATCNTIYFLKSGLIRGYIINEAGVEQTIWVRTGGRFTTDYRAFINKEPSNLQIEVLQDTLAICLPYDNMQYLYNHVPEFNKFCRIVTEQYLIKIMDELRMLQILASPLKRYEAFLEIHADIADQIPQHMVADMINVTPVHLSRLRSSYAKSHSKKNKE